MSFLDGKYIHKTLLEIANGDKFVYNKALKMLQSRSIVKCHTSTIPGNDPVEVVTIHELYQTVLRADQEKKGKVKALVAQMLNFFFFRYTAYCSLDPYHEDFGKEWYLHLLHIVNQNKLENYALEQFLNTNSLFLIHLIPN